MWSKFDRLKIPYEHAIEDAIPHTHTVDVYRPKQDTRKKFIKGASDTMYDALIEFYGVDTPDDIKEIIRTMQYIKYIVFRNIISLFEFA
jgi:hypothetical protein